MKYYFYFYKLEVIDIPISHDFFKFLLPFFQQNLIFEIYEKNEILKKL